MYCAQFFNNCAIGYLDGIKSLFLIVSNEGWKTVALGNAAEKIDMVAFYRTSCIGRKKVAVMFGKLAGR